MGDRFDLFAATPPVEAKRMLFQLAASKAARYPESKYRLYFIDMEKPH